MIPAFKPGARVYVDGRTEATVKAHFPEGSHSFPAPHYVVQIKGEGCESKVKADRVGVNLKPAGAAGIPALPCPLHGVPECALCCKPDGICDFAGCLASATHLVRRADGTRLIETRPACEEHAARMRDLDGPGATCERIPAPPVPKAPPPRGTCDACGKSFKLTLDGALPKHLSPRPELRGQFNCKGSRSKRYIRRES